MIRYALRRLLLVPLALLGVSLVSFALTRIIPGDPTDRLVGAAFLTEEYNAAANADYPARRPGSSTPGPLPGSAGVSCRAGRFR